MAIKVRPNVSLVGDFTMLITGLATDGLPIVQWHYALNQIGEALQSKIANTFAAQRTAKGTLLRNSRAYTAWKISHGYDARKGHKTRALQTMLDPRASKLFYIQGPFKNGTARIVFSESRLHGIVPYAEYYEEAKVQGGNILALARTWVLAARGPIDQAQALALKVREADKGVQVGKAAVFKGRPAFIKPAVGLSQKFTRNLTKGLSPGRLGNILKLIK